MPYDSILFDFDGVLADTEPMHYASWIEILRPLGIEMDWDTYARNGVGVSDMEFARFVAGCANPPADPAYIRSLYPEKNRRFVEAAKRHPPVPEAVLDLVQSLDQYRLAIVTSSPKLEIEPILCASGVCKSFETIVYGGDVKNRKPHPDPYLLAASRLQAVSPLVVEDSDAGEAAGRSAGFDVLRVPDVARMPAMLRKALG